VAKKRPVNLSKLARRASSSVAQSGLPIDLTSDQTSTASGIPENRAGPAHRGPSWSAGPGSYHAQAERIYSPRTIIQSIHNQSDSSNLRTTQRSPTRSGSQSSKPPESEYLLPSFEGWNPLVFMDDTDLFSSFIDLEVSAKCCLGDQIAVCLPCV